MSYYAVSAMSTNSALRDRIISAAAQEGEQDPLTWAATHVYEVVSRTDWVEKWDYAEDTKTRNVNPNTGERDDVINDSMILAAVQDVRSP
jgi:hypothetical protein